MINGKGFKFCSICAQDYPAHTAGCRALYWHMRSAHKLDHAAAYSAVGEATVEFHDIFSNYKKVEF